MTKERLLRVSDEKLLVIAEKEGIYPEENYDKSVLINRILEVMEEERQERDISNNPAMKIKEKKYDILKNEELETQIKTEYPLPCRYNETRVVMILRDPLWAYTYWDLNSGDLLKIEQSIQTGSFFLRVYELSGFSFSESNIIDFFNIELQLTDTSRYINLPIPGRNYCLELGYNLGGKEQFLCRSNIIKSPLGEVTRGITREKIDDTENDLFVLSGIYNFNSSSSLSGIPQRIISMLDTQYLALKG